MRRGCRVVVRGDRGCRRAVRVMGLFLDTTGRAGNWGARVPLGCLQGLVLRVSSLWLDLKLLPVLRLRLRLLQPRMHRVRLDHVPSPLGLHCPCHFDHFTGEDLGETVDSGDHAGWDGL